MPPLRPVAMLCLVAAAVAAEDPVADLRLETHGFASFGYLRSWERPSFGDSLEGTADFWEAAINAIARPLDHLRLGAQLFTRDLGDYDNGKPQLDWAYADWRANDAVGLQAGRIRIPIGLYNEVLDVDAARTAVFLPVSIYNPRNRDLFISVDGAKIYGSVPLAAAGSLEYQAFVGTKDIDTSLGFATYFIQQGLGTAIDSISVDASFGGQVRWETPFEGLTCSATLVDAHGFVVDAETPALGIESRLRVADYYLGVASLLIERGDWTFALEYARFSGHGTIEISPLGLTQPYQDQSDGAYASATWHQESWLEWYGAVEESCADIGARQERYLYSAVGAVDLMPLHNWSLKAEYRENWHGDDDLARSRSVALKTTVDF